MTTHQVHPTALLLALLLAACGAPNPEGETESNTYPSIGRIERLDPALDELVPEGAVLEILATGYEWAEGPLWISAGDYVLFSDVPTNRVHKWNEQEGASTWLVPSGYTGDTPHDGELGSNGLLLDAFGRLVLCQHGDRRVARLEVPLATPTPKFLTVADRYEGSRFNSPNDAVFHSSGALYFTDPPYGLPQGPDDQSREMEFSGVFRVGPAGEVSLLTEDLSRPNGIAFSPDESLLYVANSDPENAIWMVYEVAEDGTLDNGRVFFDATALVPDRPGLPDGLKVDSGGNLFATGPGGVLVFSPEGRHLGTLDTTQATANCAFGQDGAVLYITADSYLLRVRLDG